MGMTSSARDVDEEGERAFVTEKPRISCREAKTITNQCIRG